METVASKVPFADLCCVCERISNKQGKQKKMDVLNSFIRQWRDFHNKLHKTDTTDSFYPAMRLLLPHLERERAAYGIKEFMLAKLYIEILCLSKDSDDAQKLLNYRFSRNTKTEAGDFANVAYHVLSLRCPEKGTLSIEEVNNCLDSIATNNALKNKDEMKKSILRLLRNTSAREQKWLIRMIMKDLKMGISENTVFAAYHPDAKDLFDVTSSLSKVCSMLKNPNIRLNEIEISLFNPFRPMLAEYAPPKQIEKLMNNQAFHIETKYDGERIQLHKEGNKYMYFSRNCIDFTDYYGSTSFKGSFTPFIDRAFSSKVKNCILDGEIVGYNTKLNCIGSKGENFDVKNLHPGDIYQQCIIIFDILFYNDKVLTNYPLSERLQYLENLFTPIEGRIQCSPVKHASTEKEVVDALNEAIDNREEGIMIKDMSSVYYPNSRKRGWVKVKPEYVNNLTDELDLLIIGGYFGEGRRGGLISHFLLGVCANDKNDENPVFYSFTKVGSGYSYKELCDLLTKLNTNWNIYDKKNPPSNIILAPGHKEKPDVWIKPENSAVLQVKAAEITQSDQFKTGCSLRFPRVEKIRYDKSWNQCLTLSELENLRKEGGGKLAGRYCTITTDQNYEISPKKRKVILTSVKPTVAPHFQPADISDIKVKSHMFEEKEFCVINGPPSHSKHTLEKLIAEYGGNITQNPGMNTFCVIVDKVTLKAKNIIAKKQYNVVKVTWLLKCIDQNSFIPWKPYDLLSSSYSTSERFSEDFDKYGDSYTNNITEFELKEIFQQISEEECKEQCSNEEIAEKELKYFPNESLHGLFRIFRIYIDDKAILGEENTKIKSHSLGITELQLRLYGATIISKVDENTTHVITYSGDSSRYKMLRQMNRTRQKMFHLVTEDWVRECIKNKRLLNERHYQPNL